MSEVDQLPPDNTPPPPPPAEHDDVSSPEEIQRARQYGWSDKDEFHGPPDQWKPAKDFLAVGEKNNAILNKRIRDLEARLAETQKSADEARSYFTNLEKAVEQRTRENLKAEMAKAISNGDGEAFARLQTEMDQLQAKPPEPPKEPEKPDPQAFRKDPVFQQWQQRNDWFDKDMFLSQQAIIAAQAMINTERQRGNMPTLDEVLQYAEQTVKEYFPHKFATRQGNGRQFPTVEGSGYGGRRAPRQKGFNELPPDAKEAALSLQRQGIIGMKGQEGLENYAKNYFKLNPET